MDKPHQRKGAASNSQVGRDFENKALLYFSKRGITLEKDFPLSIGISQKKIHRFDLGSANKKIIVECKSHRWTEGNNVPSAKIRAWNEAMFLFYVTPSDYKKIFFILKDTNKKGKTLADHYIETYNHLIPDDVEIIEFDEVTNQPTTLRRAVASSETCMKK